MIAGIKSGISAMREAAPRVANSGKMGLKDMKSVSRSGKAAARRMPSTVDFSESRMGRGLSTMRKHKARTGLVVGAGMGVAAGVRNTGSGTSSGSTSLYRH